MTSGSSRASVMIAAAIALALSGCASILPGEPAAPSAPAPATKVTVDQLIGNWGLASYHKEEDRARTEKAAAAQCNKPYVIAKGDTDGAMMYLADESKPSELFVKGSTDGRTFIGLAGDPGGQTDREVLSYDNGVLVTQWVDPDVAARYGTMVFVRCGEKPEKAMKARAAKPAREPKQPD